MRNSVLETAIHGGKARTSHAHVVDQIGKAIVSGEFPIGSLLPNDMDLAIRFGVSRTVLRETMKTLAAKGMVLPRARIGTRVTPANEWNLFDSDVLTWHFADGVSKEFLHHLSEIRLAFEPHAASLAASRASEAEIANLMRLAVLMGDPKHTTETLAKADLRFHLAIAEASGNPFMRTVGSLIEAGLTGIFKMSSPGSDRDRIDDVAHSHVRIVEYISRRDAAGARMAMEYVIRVGRDRVI